MSSVHIDERGQASEHCGQQASRQLRQQLRASTGTCIALGLLKGRCDVLLTTAYLLLGDGCRRACAFCAQSSRSCSEAGMLSRVSWPVVDLCDLLDRLHLVTSELQSFGETSKDGIGDPQLKRVCIQTTDRAETMEDLLALVPLIKQAARVLVSVSFRPHSLEDITRLFDAGVDRLGIAIDAADPETYAKVKGGRFESAKTFLLSAASMHKGKISTHIIVGLGETEESVVKLISECLSSGLTVGLFAFTPVKGTALESHRPPEIGHYRRVQAGMYLLKLGLVSVDDFCFRDGLIRSINVQESQAIQALSSGEAFLTSGCEFCNRPYYNERPGSVLYNYPRPLTKAEVTQAIVDTQLWTVETVEHELWRGQSL